MWFVCFKKNNSLRLRLLIKTGFYCTSHRFGWFEAADGTNTGGALVSHVLKVKDEWLWSRQIPI